MFDFINISIVDIIDIFVVALIVYYIYRLTKGTHAPSILSGIFIIYLLWLAVKALNMELLSAILGHIIGVGVIALIVVFQPEIRRFLQILGTRSKHHRNSFWTKMFPISESKPGNIDIINPIVKACSDMSSSKTGALIVIQRDTDLSAIAESGVMLDAKLSAPLIKNLFFKNSPLHDGAILIINGQISAAKCILPTTTSEVPLAFGMRHRAAMGMSEESDAITIVVSEETGVISIFISGTVHTEVTPADLRKYLLKSIS